MKTLVPSVPRGNDAPIAPQQVNNTRYEMRHHAGKTRAGRLSPIFGTAVLGREAGMLSQNIGIELAPVAGRMISQIFAELTLLFIPTQAVDRLLNGDTDENAGITEVLRRRIMEKEVLFPLENEGEVTKRMGLVPRSVSGAKKVSSIARIAHNAGVNYLRKRAYIYATELEHDNAAVTPSIISETVLNRFTGVLDPDDHINGNVSLDLSLDSAPVKGLSLGPSPTSSDLRLHRVDGTSVASNGPFVGITNTSGTLFVKPTNVVPNNTAGSPPLYPTSDLTLEADLSAIAAGGFSLTDLYNAQKADDLVRKMRAIADANPMDGEDAVLRWAFGLSADSAQHPFELYRRRVPLGVTARAATDQAGLTDETIMSYAVDRFSYSVPLPATELGGMVIAFLSVTPDEVVDQQPHPILSDSWTAINHASQTMRLDPEPVTYRDLYADIDTASQEVDVKFYTGANALKKTYINFGFNRHVDPTTVEAKTVLWQYPIPAGVSPDNILYPAELDQYPFLDQLAEVATYDISSNMVLQTNMFFGPTPVEKLAIIDDSEILE